MDTVDSVLNVGGLVGVDPYYQAGRTAPAEKPKKAPAKKPVADAAKAPEVPAATA